MRSFHLLELLHLGADFFVRRTTEIAAGFKEQANSLFAARKFRDAIGFYTRAIDEVGKDLEVEERRVLWCNRAAANLELGKCRVSFTTCVGITSANQISLCANRELRGDPPRRFSRSWIRLRFPPRPTLRRVEQDDAESFITVS